MLIFGHPHLPSVTLYHIEEPDALLHTPPNSVVFVPCDPLHRDLIAQLRRDDVAFALGAASVKDALFAENLGARYIVVEPPLAPSVQKVAETYLFDAKILCRIDDESQIETMAFEGIDGVIFPEAIVKVAG